MGDIAAVVVEKGLVGRCRVLLGSLVGLIRWERNVGVLGERV